LYYRGTANLVERVVRASCSLEVKTIKNLPDSVPLRSHVSEAARKRSVALASTLCSPCYANKIINSKLSFPNQCILHFKFKKWSNNSEYLITDRFIQQTLLSPNRTLVLI